MGPIVGRAISRFVVVLATVTWVAPSALATEPAGPAFENRRYKASIDNVAGSADVDTYVGRLATGERLTISVTASRRDALLPQVELIGPSGPVDAGFVERRGGKQLLARNYVVPEAGLWALRISDRAAAEGEYEVSFRARRARPTRYRNVDLSAAAPTTVDYTVGAFEGALLRLVLVPRGGSTAALLSLRDPAGDEVPGAGGPLVSEHPPRRGGRVTILNRPLAAGDGDYTATVGVGAGEAGRYHLLITAKAPRRARGRVRLLPEDDPFLDDVAQPLAAAEGAVLHLTGANFSADPAARPVVRFDDVDVTVEGVDTDGTWIDVRVPAAPAPLAIVDVTVINPDGQSALRPGYASYAPQLVDVTGSALPAPDSVDDLSAATGVVADLDGDQLDDLVLVSHDDETALSDARLSRPTALTATPDPADATPYDIAVLGERDRYSFTLPQREFVIIRVLLASLGDSEARLYGPDDPQLLVAFNDDVPGSLGSGFQRVLQAGTWEIEVAGLEDGETGTYDVELRRLENVAPVGTRDSRTRVLFGTPGGALVDRTATNFPGTGSAAAPFDEDDWSGTAVTVGDVDLTNGPDLVLAGRPPPRTTTDYYGSPLQSFGYAPAVRLFSNDGAGTLTFDPALQAPSAAARPDLMGVDPGAQPVAVLSMYYRYLTDTVPSRPVGDRVDLDRTFPEEPTAVAVGDLDGDLDEDVVVLFPEPSRAFAWADLAYVDFTQSPPYVSDTTLPQPFDWTVVGGLEILDNQIGLGYGLVYETALRVPLSFERELMPSFHGTDLALGDVDGDQALDLVVTWVDPWTVSAKGRLEARRRVSAQPSVSATRPSALFSTDVQQVATRVLLNRGDGTFIDGTAAWMPPGAGAEFWQGGKVELADLDGDTDLDMVLLHPHGIAFPYLDPKTPLAVSSAAGTTTPGDIAVSLEQDEFDFTVTATGTYLVHVRSGTLPRLILDVRGPDDPGKFVSQSIATGPGRATYSFAELAPGAYLVRVKGVSAGEVGTYALTVDRVQPRQVPADSGRALRVLENQGAGTGFVDVTATALPALVPGGDDLHGESLLVRNVNGDGDLDLVVGTPEELLDGAGGPLRSTRVLFGAAGLTFVRAHASFLPDFAADSGEAMDLLMGDLGDSPLLFFVTESQPRNSPGGAQTRALDR